MNVVVRGNAEDIAEAESTWLALAVTALILEHAGG